MIIGTLKEVNKNKMNADLAHELGDEAYKMAEEINKDAEDLAKIMADRNKGMTLILIGIAVLLGLAVFANLYSTFKGTRRRVLI